MLVRRAALSLWFVIGLSTLAACAAEGEPQGPTLHRGADAEETPAPTTSTSRPSDPAPTHEETTTPDEPSPAVEDIAVKKELNITWKGQETGYWCGPGSTRMAISARAKELPTQSELASFMGTHTGGTDHVGLVVGALNKYIDGAGYVVREVSDPPTAAQSELLRKDLVKRISAGYPLVANVISGWRPAGYPGGTIYHYVAIVGYDESGNKALIADPAAEGSGGAGWGNVTRTYWVSLDNLAVWIGGKGYTG